MQKGSTPSRSKILSSYKDHGLKAFRQFAMKKGSTWNTEKILDSLQRSKTKTLLKGSKPETEIPKL